MTSNSWTVKFGRIWSVKCDVCSVVLGSARLEVTDKFGDYWVSFSTCATWSVDWNVRADISLHGCGPTFGPLLISQHYL